MNTDSDINKEISEWKSKITIISRNLMEFSDDLSTKTVQNTFKSLGYSGLTDTTAAKSIKTLDVLWEQYLIAARVIDEAQELAKKNGIFHNNEIKIKELLEGKSVVIYSEYIPIESRGLLVGSKVETYTTLSAILKLMETSFIETRNAITSIITANKQLESKRMVIKQKMDRLAAWSKSLDIDSSIVLPGSPYSLIHSFTDPLSLLSCTSEFAHFEAELKKCQEQLQTIEVDRNEVFDLLKKADSFWAELKSVVELSREAIQETIRTIFSPNGLVAVMDDEKLKLLQSWKETLQKTIHSGKYSAAKIGLKKWIEECRLHLQQEQSNYKTNKSLLEEKEELRGQYKALFAKTEKLKRDGILLDITDLFKQSQKVLYAMPYDVLAGRQAIQKIKTALTKDV